MGHLATEILGHAHQTEEAPTKSRKTEPWEEGTRLGPRCQNFELHPTYLGDHLMRKCYVYVNLSGFKGSNRPQLMVQISHLRPNHSRLRRVQTIEEDTYANFGTSTARHTYRSGMIFGSTTILWNLPKWAFSYAQEQNLARKCVCELVELKKNGAVVVVAIVVMLLSGACRVESLRKISPRPFQPAITY